MSKGMDQLAAHQAALQALNAQIQHPDTMLNFNDALIFVLIVFLVVSPSILLLRTPARSGQVAGIDAH